MRVKVKGGKWKGLDKGPIALELTLAEKDMIAAAPSSQSLFVFGDAQAAKWAGEENPVEKKEFKEVKEKTPAAKKPPAKKKAAKGK